MLSMPYDTVQRYLPATTASFAAESDNCAWQLKVVAPRHNLPAEDPNRNAFQFQLKSNCRDDEGAF